MAIPIHKLAKIRVATECCVVYDNKVLVQQRSSMSDFFPNYLTFPGGHVDEGEDTKSTVVREVLEETSVKLNPKDVSLKIQALNHHIDNEQVWVIFGFYCELNSYQEPISTEEGEVYWMDIESFRKSDKVFPPVAYYLDHIFESNQILYMNADFVGGNLKQVNSRSV